MIMGYMKEKHAEQIADQISLEDLGGMKRGGFTPLPNNEPTLLMRLTMPGLHRRLSKKPYHQSSARTKQKRLLQ